MYVSVFVFRVKQEKTGLFNVNRMGDVHVLDFVDFDLVIVLLGGRSFGTTSDLKQRSKSVNMM